MGTLGYNPADYTAEQRAHDILLFIGKNRYYDLEVRIKSIADNAAVVVSEGQHRVVPWSDMSYASEWIARDNLGRIVLLKIRKWQ